MTKDKSFKKEKGDLEAILPPPMEHNIKGKTFKTAEEVPLVFTGTFEDCEFKMDTLEKRNFANVKFVKCTFAKGFKFIRCNLFGATGVENAEKEHCLVARSTPIKAPKGDKPKKKR